MGILIVVAAVVIAGLFVYLRSQVMDGDGMVNVPETGGHGVGIDTETVMKNVSLDLSMFPVEIVEDTYYEDNVLKAKFTNNSDYPIISAAVYYRVKDNASDEELMLFDEFAKSIETQGDPEAMACIVEDYHDFEAKSNIEAYIGPGESIVLDEFYTIWGDITGKFTTRDEFSAMEIEKLEITIIHEYAGITKGVICTGDYKSGNWNAEMMDTYYGEFNDWYTDKFTAALVKPEKLFRITYNISSHMEYEIYDSDEDYCLNYIEALKQKGFDQDVSEYSYDDGKEYRAKNADGNSIYIRYYSHLKKMTGIIN